MSDENRAKRIFQEALDKPADERASYLDRVCGEGPLRHRVNALLTALDEIGESLKQPTGVPEPDPTEGPGATIGRYKLLQEIGEGGFGVVYMAEQLEPVRRKVALKVIKLGMDTHQVVARFEAERQALALMDHPNIARILDGGATRTGRPYFVMELVKGIPITEYCDQAQLDTQERLDLFAKVCHAVQHAHQKGIIHRDLKPSNVLVTLHDGRPVPKVIDFGIAKATNHHLTEKTLFTEFRQMIGTPDYMAPEQAELSGLDVDTRADVYSLGVLLYELLTGTKPFDLKSAYQAGYEEIVRTIREVEPPKPSTRLSTMGDLLQAVAKQRHTRPALLGKLVRGDLDWIVMKALEKDRSRRYETASAMAMDVRRFLDDEPVYATPPTTRYRVRKYLRRHRVGVTAAAIVTLALLAGTGLAVAGVHRARIQTAKLNHAESTARAKRAEADQARTRERAQRTRAETGTAEARKEARRAKTVLNLMDRMLTSADPDQAKGRNYTVRQLFDDFEREAGDSLTEEPEVEIPIRLAMGSVYASYQDDRNADRNLERAEALCRDLPEDHPLQVSRLLARGSYFITNANPRKALPLLQQAITHRGETERERSGITAAHFSLSEALMLLQRFDEAESHARRVLPLLEKPRERASGLVLLASIHAGRGKYAEAEKLIEQALRIHAKQIGKRSIRYANGLRFLAEIKSAQRQYAEALALLQEILDINREQFGEEHVRVSEFLHEIGLAYLRLRDFEQADHYIQDSLTRLTKAYPASHRSVLRCRNTLALLRMNQERYPEALAILQKLMSGIDAQKELDPRSVNVVSNVAETLLRLGQYDDALRYSLRLLKTRRKIYGDEHPSIAHGLNLLGVCYGNLGRSADAEQALRESVRIGRKFFPDEHGSILTRRSNLADCLLEQGKLKEAEALYRTVIADAKKSGDRHLSVRIRSDIGRLYRRQGKFDEAVVELRSAVEEGRKVFPKGSMHMADTLTSFGDTLIEFPGRYQAALAAYSEALAIFRAVFGKEHPKTAIALRGVAVCELRLGHAEDALRHASQALATHRKMSRNQLVIAAALSEVASCEGALGNYGAAIRHTREAVALRKAGQGELHIDYAVTLGHLAALLLDSGDHEASIDVFRRQVAIYREVLKPTHPYLATARGNLAWILVQSGKHAEAEAVYREVVARTRDLYSADDPRLAGWLIQWGVCLTDQGRFREAIPHLRECLAIRTKRMPKHWLRFNAMSCLGEALLGQKKYLEAEALLVEGYQKMQPPAANAKRKRQALARIVKLYEAWGKPEQAARWKKEQQQ